MNVEKGASHIRENQLGVLDQIYFHDGDLYRKTPGDVGSIMIIYISLLNT